MSAERQRSVGCRSTQGGVSQERGTRDVPLVHGDLRVDGTMSSQDRGASGHEKCALPLGALLRRTQGHSGLRAGYPTTCLGTVDSRTQDLSKSGLRVSSTARSQSRCFQCRSCRHFLSGGPFSLAERRACTYLRMNCCLASDPLVMVGRHAGLQQML